MTASAAAEPARGAFGITVAVTADGWFNPTVRSAKVAKVQPELPAARAGVAVGDQVVEVDGRRVPGANASDLAPLAQGKRVGEPVELLLARPDGSHYRVRLVAVSATR